MEGSHSHRSDFSDDQSVPESSEENEHPKHLHIPQESQFYGHSSHLSQFNADDEFVEPPTLSKFAPASHSKSKSPWGCVSVGLHRGQQEEQSATPNPKEGSASVMNRFPRLEEHRHTVQIIKQSLDISHSREYNLESEEQSMIRSPLDSRFLEPQVAQFPAERPMLGLEQIQLNLPFDEESKQTNSDHKAQIEFVPIKKQSRTPVDIHSRVQIPESKGKTTKATDFPSDKLGRSKVKKRVSSKPSSLGDPLKKFLDKELCLESSSSDSDSSIAARTSSHQSTIRQSSSRQSNRRTKKLTKNKPVHNYKREMKKQHQAFELKRLNNTRVWILWNLCIKIIQDVTIIYPSFQEQPRFPNQVFIFLQGICTYFILMGIIQSYWFKILKPVNWMLYVLVFNDQLGFYIAFGDHQGRLHDVSGLLQELTLAFQIIWNLLMVVQQMEGRRAKIAMVLSNSALMMFSITLTTIDISQTDKMDWFQISLSCCTIIFLSTMFAFIEENVIKSNIEENLLDSSYKQYRQIFNRLQEGIFVIRYDPRAKVRVERRSFLNFGQSISESSTKDEFKLYFVNQMCNRILSKVYDMQNFMKLHFKKNRLNHLGIQEVLRRKVFYEYKSKTSNFSPKTPNLHIHNGRTSCLLSAFSLEDLLSMSQDEINQRVFTFRASIKEGDEEDYTEIQEVIAACPNMAGISTEFLPNFLYFQIKRSQVLLPNGQTQFTIQLIDISSKIFYDDIKAQEQFTALINSTISHEMRNPLNSIINQCIIQRSHLGELQTAFSKISMDYFSRKECTSIVHEMKLSNDVSDNSSQLLLFHVQDILDMAQLKSGNFRKTVTRFNVKSAVEQILQIQKYSADEKGITMHVDFINFPKVETTKTVMPVSSQVGGLIASTQSEKADYRISSDKKRLQQVLLNLQSNALKFSRKGDSISIKVYYIPKKQDGLQVIEEEGEETRSPMRFLQEIPELSFSDDSFFQEEDRSESAISSESEASKEPSLQSTLNKTSQNKNSVSRRRSSLPAQRNSLSGKLSLQHKSSQMGQSHIISKKNQDQKTEVFKQGDQEKLVISVLDTGIGIKRHDQRKLFRMFGWLKNTRQMNTQGIGLGLFICKQISQEFGGNIFVQSQYRRGTRFTFSFALDSSSSSPPPSSSSKPTQIKSMEKLILPSGRAPEPSLEVQPGDFSPSISEGASAKAKIEKDFHEPPGFLLSASHTDQQFEIPRFNLFGNHKVPNQGKILIADDEAFNIQAIKGILRVLGIRDVESRVVSCFNGEELLAEVKEAISDNDPFRYPLILTDCSMPILDGYEAAKEIRYQFKLLRSLQDRKMGCLSEVGQDSVKDDVQRIKKRVTSDKIEKDLAASARKKPSTKFSQGMGNQMKIPVDFPRIIAVTGHVEPEYIQKAFDKGIDRVFSKPLPVLDLGEELKKLEFISNIPEGIGREESDFSP